MPETPEGLLARLSAAGIAAETRHHRPVFTVAEGRDIAATLPGGHTKNLFLRPAKGDGPFLLATLEADRQISVNALARQAGIPRVSMASAEDLIATLGVPPGSVTPFGLVNAAPGAVRFVIDRHLVDAALLRDDELDWLNAYHAEVAAKLAPGLGGADRDWLLAACAPIARDALVTAA